MGPWRRPSRALAPAPSPVPCAARPSPRPPDPAPPQQRVLAGAPGAPRVTSGQIQRDVLLAAVIPPCAKQTQTQLGFEGRPAAADLAPARVPLASLAQGQGVANARGGGHRAVGVRRGAGLPRIRRFFSERPRPIAAILTGFSHNTGNLAQSRENPFPSPRAAPGPSGISPALPWRRVAGCGGSSAAVARGARCRLKVSVERASCTSSHLGTGERGAAPDPPGEWLLGGDISHEGNPIDKSLQRGRCFPLSRRGNRTQN